MHSAASTECFQGNQCTHDSKTPKLLAYCDKRVSTVPITSDGTNAIAEGSTVQTKRKFLTTVLSNDFNHLEKKNTINTYFKIPFSKFAFTNLFKIEMNIYLP